MIRCLIMRKVAGLPDAQQLADVLREFVSSMLTDFPDPRRVNRGFRWGDSAELSGVPSPQPGTKCSLNPEFG